MNQRDGQVMTDTELQGKLDAQTGAKVRPEDLDAVIVKEAYHQWPGTLLITCVLTLKNGFNVSGESACANPAIFDEAVGKTIARRNAKDKLWSLLGYQLKEKLHLIEQAGAPTGAVAQENVKTYIGTKVVHAVPMTRAAYNKLRGWQLPDNEDGDDEGYLVQYTDGGDTNVAGYTGYVSWSPQDVFERAYSTGVTLKETTYVDRMVKELEELTERTTKLGDFLKTEQFVVLPEKKRVLLCAQHTAMMDYQWHLLARVRSELHPDK